MDQVAKVAREAQLARTQLRRAAGDERALVTAMRRYDGVLARLAELVEVERPPLVDKTPSGRNRRRAEMERRLADAGIDLRG